MTARRTAVLGSALVLALAVAGCGSSSPRPGSPPTASPPPASSSGPTGNAADAAFVLHMLPHHRRALEVGALAAARGSDPRVRAFGRRIVAEQTPEEQRLAGWVPTLRLTVGPGDAMAADGYIDDATLARLRTEAPVAFDRDVLLASASSETGAAAMARAELADGRFGPARELATSIAGAPDGEIPELRALAAALPTATR